MNFAIRLIFGLIFETGLATTYMVIAGLVKEWLNHKTSPVKAAHLMQYFVLLYFTVVYILILAIKVTGVVEFSFDNTLLLLIVMFAMISGDSKMNFLAVLTSGVITLLTLGVAPRVNLRLVPIFYLSTLLLLLLSYLTEKRGPLLRWLSFLVGGLIFWAVRSMLGLVDSQRLIFAASGYVVLSSIIFWLLYLNEKHQKISARNQHDAFFDEMTATKNYRAFVKELDQGVQAYHDHGQALGLIMVDIDHFKNVNDTYGHLMGNEILKEVTATLKEQAQTLTPAANVYRLGGEEFALLVREQDCRKVAQFAELCHTSVGALHAEQPNQVQVTISLGYSKLRDKEPAMQFFQRVDKLLYQAKKQGRDVAVGSCGTSVNN